MEGSESTTLNRGGATGWVDTGDQEGVISPKVVLASLSMGDFSLMWDGFAFPSHSEPFVHLNRASVRSYCETRHRSDRKEP
jgi:hypothetical protein